MSPADKPRNQAPYAAEACPTVLLDDAPASEDMFALDGKIGPHERIAETLTQIIRTRQAGGKMIGLEGGWGSGKTTVVNLMQRALKEDSQTRIIVFDAWAHEGDPLRRTFLETLIGELQAECTTAGSLVKDAWIRRRDWKSTLEELAHRHKSTITRTLPKSTAFGRWLAATALLVPIGLVLFKTGLDAGVTLRGAPDLRPAWTFIIGLTLSLSPGIVSLVFFLLHQGQQSKRRIRPQSNSRTDFEIF
jgi:energy-coupling factor transporter ATP-binding protein EcfA2